MRWLSFVVISGCVCVPEPDGSFPCASDEDCARGNHCIAGRCSGASSDAGSGCMKSSSGIAMDCKDLACSGQPCQFNSITRGICCGTHCIDPMGGDNCGGCGNTCPSNFCASASDLANPPVVSGYCSCLGSTCPGTQTCFNTGCVCLSDADCLTGQQCTMKVIMGMSVGVCWYPP